MKALIRFKSSFFDRSRRNQFVPISNFSKSSKPNKTHETSSKIQAETTPINKITKLFVSDVVRSDQTTRSKANVTKTRFNDRALVSCTQGVCENATERFSVESENILKEVLEEFDVSPLVNEITNVVMANDELVSMEDRLEKLSFRFEPEIVEKVLKKCFKAPPNLAIRFFNFVKYRDGFEHRVGVYNTMLCIAWEQRDLGMVDVLVKEMEKNNCVKDIKTWNILVSVYGKEPLVLERGFEPDDAAYSSMIRSLFGVGRGDLAIEFYKEMSRKGVSFGLRTYKMLLDCVAGLEKVDVGKSVVDDMVRKCEVSELDAFGYLLKSFCVSGKIKEAMELISELEKKDMCIDAKYFEILVKGLCRAKRMVEALEIVDVMKKRKLDDSNVYGIMITAYLKQNDASKALEQLEFMKNSGYSPRVFTYTHVIQHLFKIKEFEKGCNLFNEMIENGVEPENVAIIAVIAYHVGENQVEEAWKVFNIMEEKGIKPTWKYYSVFVKELCRSAEYDEMLKVLYRMLGSKIVVRDDMFSWVISSMEKNGEKEKIEHVKEIQKKYKSCHQELDGSRGTELSKDMAISTV